MADRGAESSANVLHNFRESRGNRSHYNKG